MKLQGSVCLWKVKQLCDKCKVFTQEAFSTKCSCLKLIHCCLRQFTYYYWFNMCLKFALQDFSSTMKITQTDRVFQYIIILFETLSDESCWESFPWDSNSLHTWSLSSCKSETWNTSIKAEHKAQINVACLSVSCTHSLLSASWSGQNDFLRLLTFFRPLSFLAPHHSVHWQL